MDSPLKGPVMRKTFPCHYNDVKNGRDSVSNYQLYVCLLNRFFRRRLKKTSKPRVTGLCAGNSPVTGEFPAQRASNAENVSIWWHHHVMTSPWLYKLYDILSLPAAVVGTHAAGSVWGLLAAGLFVKSDIKNQGAGFCFRHFGVFYVSKYKLESHWLGLQ